MKTSVSLVAALLAIAPILRGTVTENFNHAYPLNASGTVQLDNVNGDIEIVAWDKAEVSLEAEKKGKTDSDLAKVTIEIDSSPEKLSVKTKYAKSWTRNVDASVRYKLRVPAGVRLERIDAVNSNVIVNGVLGSVNLATVNGSITATGLTANARLDSVNGSVTADFNSLEGVSKVQLESVNGRATVSLPKGASARIDADSVNGRVNVDQQIKLRKVRRHALNGEIGSGGPEISIETVNGSIAIREK